MRIAMLTSAKLPPEEGIGNYVWNLSKALAAQGHEIHIITKGREPSETSIDGVKIHTCKITFGYPFYMRAQKAAANKLIQTLQLDIVHTHTPLVLPPKTQCPIVTTVHTSLVEDANYNKSMKLKVATKLFSYPAVKTLLEKSSNVAAVSPSVADEVAWHYGVPRGSIHVIFNGVASDILQIKKPKDEGFVLCVGRLDRRKGPLDLLEAAKSVDATFLIAGKGPLEKELIERASAYGISNKFRLLGHIDRKLLVQLYSTASLAVVPSYYEGLPTTLLEAMGAGLPVVATNIPSIACVVDNNKDGLLVQPGSPYQLAESINRLLSDKELRIKLGMSAREKIIHAYTWDKIAQHVKQIYEAVIE